MDWLTCAVKVRISIHQLTAHWIPYSSGCSSTTPPCHRNWLNAMSIMSSNCFRKWNAFFQKKHGDRDWMNHWSVETGGKLVGVGQGAGMGGCVNPYTQCSISGCEQKWQSSLGRRLNALERPNVKEPDWEDVKRERKWMCESGSVHLEWESDESWAVGARMWCKTLRNSEIL